MLQADLTIASLILGASLLVKLVMLVLLMASLASWTLIFTKRRELRFAKSQALEFESKFRAAGDLTALYNRVSSQRKSTEGLEKVFEAGHPERAGSRRRVAAQGEPERHRHRGQHQQRHDYGARAVILAGTVRVLVRK